MEVSQARRREVRWSRPSRCLVLVAHRDRVERRGWQCDHECGFTGGRSLAQTQSCQGAERNRTATSFRSERLRAGDENRREKPDGPDGRAREDLDGR